MIGFSLHGQCKQSYQIVYGWYEEKRDLVFRLQEENNSLHRVLGERNKELAETELLRENAQAAYDQQVSKNTYLRHEMEEWTGWREQIDDLMEGRISFEVARSSYLAGKYELNY